MTQHLNCLTGVSVRPLFPPTDDSREHSSTLPDALQVPEPCLHKKQVAVHTKARRLARTFNNNNDAANGLCYGQRPLSAQ